jgi:hypothetical protein
MVGNTGFPCLATAFSPVTTMSFAPCRYNGPQQGPESVHGSVSAAERSMIQFLADQLDQLDQLDRLDLALDQLALKDCNFDRFAPILIDNAVELTLHQHAQDIRQTMVRGMTRSSLPTPLACASTPR